MGTGRKACDHRGVTSRALALLAHGGPFSTKKTYAYMAPQVLTVTLIFTNDFEGNLRHAMVRSGSLWARLRVRLTVR